MHACAHVPASFPLQVVASCRRVPTHPWDAPSSFLISRFLPSDPLTLCRTAPHPPPPRPQVIPFTIRRYLPDGSYEDHDLKDLIIPER